MFALACALPSRASAADYTDARYRILSAPDCADATRMVIEYDAAPRNATYMRVQHVGDPGTAELAGEVANVVTWDVGALSGLRLTPATFAQTQRGYRDVAPPAPSSAFQLACDGAGFVLDSRSFSHASALLLEGPSVSVARDLSPPVAVFGNATSALTIDARVRLPWTWAAAPPLIDGTAQLSFFYYALDTTTGTAFAHTIALYDNRPAFVGGANVEAVSADAYTAFVESPLSDGAAFVIASPLSARVQFVDGWSDARFFRAHVTYAQFAAMLSALADTSLPAISRRPEDYRVTSFGLLGEIFPGTTTSHEVALGGSVTGLTLGEASYDVTAVRVIEFYNATLDHYFISARAEDIDALDAGRFAGWKRTGATFGAYPAFVGGSSPVCRFYLPPPRGDSHFLSASDAECRAVAAAFPDFVLEDSSVMYVGLPDVETGGCASGSVPVYRLWNARAATNHRYTTDAATRAAMMAAGWISEGYGALGVAMCAPPPP